MYMKFVIIHAFNSKSKKQKRKKTEKKTPTGYT